jgi:hypothetical protein
MSTVYIRAEDIVIESDEDGFCLFVTDEDSGNSIRINIQHMVLDFYAAVRKEIGPYAAEAESARAAVAAGVSLEDYTAVPQLVTNRPVSVEDAIEAGYALDDPKSPGYHDRMVGDH